MEPANALSGHVKFRDGTIRLWYNTPDSIGLIHVAIIATVIATVVAAVITTDRRAIFIPQEQAGRAGRGPFRDLHGALPGATHAGDTVSDRSRQPP